MCINNPMDPIQKEPQNAVNVMPPNEIHKDPVQQDQSAVLHNEINATDQGGIYHDPIHNQPVVLNENNQGIMEGLPNGEMVHIGGVNEEIQENRQEYNEGLNKKFDEEADALLNIHDELRTAYIDGKLLARQICWRLEKILNLMDSEEIPDVTSTVKPYVIKKHNVAIEGLKLWRQDLGKELSAEDRQDLQLDMKEHIEHLGCEKERLADTNTIEELEKPAKLPLAKLSRLDKWLLMEYLKAGGNLEDSLLFSFLNRPRTERLFGYYLMQNGYSKKIKEQDVLLFDPETYELDEDKIKKEGFHLSKLGQVYRQMCQAGSFLSNMLSLKRLGEELEAERNENQDANSKFGDELGKAMAESFLPQIENLRDKLRDLDEKKKKYDDASFVRKLFMKGTVKEAVGAVYQELDTLLGTEIQIPGEKDISNFMDYVKFTIFGITGGKSVVAPVGKSLMAVKDMNWLKTTGTVGFYGANVAGGLLGIVNFTLALAGVLQSFKSFSTLNDMSKAVMFLDLTSQFGSSSSSIASSVTGVLTAAEITGQTAGAATAAAGVVTGMLTAGTGAFKLAAAREEHEQSRAAFQDLNNIRKQELDTNTQQDMTALTRNIHFESNLEKIKDRIYTRNKITAGCQMVGGILTATSSFCMLFQSPVLAAVTGLAGLAVLAGGAVVTHVMKRRGYEKVVDEFLDLQKISDWRIKEIEREGKKLKNSEKKKVRERARMELMEQFGYSDVKEFYLFVMTTYAKHIHEKIEPFLNEQNYKPDQEHEAYRNLVESLGLTINAEKEFPTEQMIFSKLTS